jgi:hypothetical protein
LVRNGGILLAVVVTLALAAGLTQAQSTDGEVTAQAAVGTAFTYQGRLTDEGSPADGEYDFEFKLFDDTSTQVGSTITVEDKTVTDGLFTVELDFGEWAFAGEARYLEIGVRPGDSGEVFTTLMPRQALTPAPYALSLRPGAKVVSEIGAAHVLDVRNEASSDLSTAIRGWATAYSGATTGVWGETKSPDGRGVYGKATAATGNAKGVVGRSDSVSGAGVHGAASAESGATAGVRGVSQSSEGSGVYGLADSEVGVGGKPYGVYGVSHSGHAVYGETTGNLNGVSGVYGKAFYNNTNGLSGVNTAGGYGVRAESDTGVALAAKSAEGNIIEAWDTDPNDRRWYVSNVGHVYADGTFHGGGADFAEMLPAAEGLEPGDVLVVGSDGQLLRSSNPRDASVVGVYSTEPGFVGGSDEEMENPGEVPLAIMGVVPVKVSAENGAIAPGDLLITSSAPGHAMKAGPNPSVGTVLGKALQPLRTGTGVIQMLVTLQ